MSISHEKKRCNNDPEHFILTESGSLCIVVPNAFKALTAVTILSKLNNKIVFA
jgi:hypothetical protein